jgi:hypothetical protein|tara:strand:+ start:524 stop:784 length:261 start_codon:yes stop_codon:yes gene_type:complete
MSKGKFNEEKKIRKKPKYQIPKTPQEVLKRIMNDFSSHNRRSKEWYDANKEMPKYPHVDYEEMRRIVQTNFRYLGVNLKQWMKDNT